MGKIDFLSIKRKNAEKEAQINENTPDELVETYTSTWGKTIEKVEEIELERLNFFQLNDKQQPFNINDEKINQIKLSAKDIGIITPLIVRKLENNYQIISGHHRFLVAKELGLLSVPCIVRDINNDIAYKYVTESNIQRMKIYPSEYGQIFLKYMELRNDIDLTAQEIADKFGISKKTMYRYMNITKLINELQSLIDKDLLNIDTIDILSTFSNENQKVICEYLTKTNKRITISLVKKISALINNNNEIITIDMIINLTKSKPKNKYKNKIYNAVAKDFNINYTEKELDNIVFNLLKEYLNQ